MDVKTFHWADYVVFTLMLLLSAAIGLYHGLAGKRNSTTDDFLMGGRDLQAIPVAMSIQASFLSAIFVLGLPAEVYTYGTMYSLIVIGYLLAYPITAHVFLPIFHRLELTSGYEYLERRYHKVIRSLGSLTFIVMTVLYMAVALYAPAIAFSQVTGLSLWLSLMGTGIVCTFYTVVGGMKAVVWTDTFQMLIILGGLFALLIKGSIDVGGIGTAWRTAAKEGRIDFSNFSPSPSERTTFWTQSIGGCFLTLALIAANQTQIQRYLSIRKTREAQKAVYFALGSAIVYLILVILVGIVMFAYYRGCDPLTSGRVLKPDQLVPLFMMDVLGQFHGLPGLFSAAVFSAALSTVSSGLNAFAAVFLEDIIRPLYVRYRQKPLEMRTATTISKVLALVFGVVTIGLAFMAQFAGSMIVQIALSIFGMAGGPLLGVMILAMLVPCTNKWGAGAGLICSLIASFWLGLGAIVHPTRGPVLPVSVNACATWDMANASLNATPGYQFLSTESPNLAPTENSTTEYQYRNPMQDFYSLSYVWYTTFAVLVTTVVALPVSFLTGFNKGKELDADLVYSFPASCSRCCSCQCERGEAPCVRRQVNDQDPCERDTVVENKGVAASSPPNDATGREYRNPSYDTSTPL